MSLDHHVAHKFTVTLSALKVSSQAKKLFPRLQKESLAAFQGYFQLAVHKEKGSSGPG